MADTIGSLGNSRSRVANYVRHLRFTLAPLPTTEPGGAASRPAWLQPGGDGEADATWSDVAVVRPILQPQIDERR